MAETWKTEGFVLKYTPFREYDRLYTLYTKEDGKITVHAQGIRKMASKLVGHCEPFVLSQFFIARGKAFDRLAGSRMQCNFRSIRSSFGKIQAGLHVLELLHRNIKEGDADEKMFSFIRGTFEALETLPDNKGAVWFFIHATELKLLTLLGIRPELSRCVEGHDVRGEMFFDVHAGGLVCYEHRKPSLSLALTTPVRELMHKSIERDVIGLMEETARRKDWQMFASVVRAFRKYHENSTEKKIQQDILTKQLTNASSSKTMIY